MNTAILDAGVEGSIEEAARLLRSGQLVAFPTETVYGLGAVAEDAAAIARVFEAKGRPSDNPLIVHVAGIDDLERCGRIGRDARRLAEAFMPGPLTIVVVANRRIPDIARAGLPTVALRIPDHPVARRLIELAGPLVAPSANLSGRPSPTTAQHVARDLSGRIAAILDGGPAAVGIESTVVDLSVAPPTILRPGHVTRTQIEDVLGTRVRSASHDEHAPKAPGMKYRHYAPTVPVRLVIAPDPPSLDDSPRLILTTAAHLDLFDGRARVVDERNIYALLREAETLGVVEVVVYAHPGEFSAGLLDRLTKAAGGGQRAEDRGRRTEDGGWRMEE